MSSETDHPRQRTVAELLAEHGGAAASTGRRRRRRESDGDDVEPVEAAASATQSGSAPARPVNGDVAANGGPVAPANSAPVNGGPAPVNGGTLNGGAPPNGSGSNGSGPNGGRPNGTRPNGNRPNGNGSGINGNGVAPAAWAFPPPGPDRSVPDRSILKKPVPQEPVAWDEHVAPNFAPRAYVPEPEPRVAPPQRSRENPTENFPRYREERGGMLDPGLTGPIEALQRPVPGKGPALDEPTIGSDDGGPATMIGAASAGAEAWHRSRTRPDDGGPATQAAALSDFDAPPAGLDDLEDGVEEPRRRLGRGAAESSPGQAWAAVVAQWIVGAIGGAALWVGFRFLWRELPVVALAAAVLVTVGLVLVVRALLRNNDMRTTVFAVLVGLLLTVSPAILVLLGR